MCKCDCDYLNGEMLFVISYEYTMFEEYGDNEDKNEDGMEIYGIATASAVDESVAILKFKRHFTANVDRRCPFENVKFEIMEAKRIMVM